MIRFKEAGQPALRVSDLERSADFYFNVLGLRVFDRPQSGLVLLGCRGTGVLYNHVAWDIGNMTDLWNCGEFLREREIPISLGPGWWEQGHQTDLNLLDPDGQRIEIYCYIDQIAGDPEPVGPSPAFYHPFDFVPPYNPHARRAGV